MGFFKKIFKGIGKIWKKIGKHIKRTFKKIGKWFGKLGVFGQIALSFIPGLGPMLAGIFKGLGAGAMKLLQVGLQHNNPLIKGASWIIDTARKVVQGVQKGFKTVTDGASSFVNNTAKYLGKKMNFDIAGPKKFFGAGGDSVLGRVGIEIKANAQGFKDAIGDMLATPSTRADLISDKLGKTKIGGVTVDTKDTAFQKPDTATEAGAGSGVAIRQIQAQDLVQDISTGIGENLGPEVQGNFDKLFKGQYKGDASDFLKVVQADPGFVNKFINMGPKKVEQWFQSAMPGTITTTDGKPFKNPFENMVFPDPANLDVETDKGFFRSLFPGSSGDDSSLLSKTGKNLTSSVANLPGSLLTSAVTQAAFGPDYSYPTPDPSRGLTQQNQFGYFRFGGGQQLEESALAYGGIGTDPSGFLTGYNQILGGMFNDGQAQGMYGFPGFNYGLQPQQQAWA